MIDWFLLFAIPLALVALIALGLSLVLAVALLLSGINSVVDYVRPVKK